MSMEDKDDDYMGPVISIDQIKPSAVKQMLVDALRREARRSLPAHRRSEAAKSVLGEEDDENDVSKENDKKVDLVEETKGKARDIPVSKNDLSRTAREALTDKRTLPKAEADDGKKARVKKFRKTNPKLRNQKKAK
jgi:hypothetical protein